MDNYNRIVLNTKNLKYNIRQYRKLNKGIKICAVVKANAYSHCLKNVVLAIDGQVEYFAVSNIFEALSVRKLTQKPIIILQPVELNNTTIAIENDIIFSVFSLKYIKKIEKIAKKFKKNVKVHIKIDSGMNRYGVKNICDFNNILRFIKKSKWLKLDGVFTHLHNQQSEKENKKQYKKFLSFISTIENKNEIIFHISSSTAVLENKLYCCDMIRIGFGMFEKVQKRNALKLKPCLSIFSKVVNVFNVKKGEYIGYGNCFKVKKDMKVATIPIGYADGFLRTNSKNGKVIIDGKFAKIVGNICMDCFMCDVSNIDCKLYSNVILLGSQNNKHISVYDLAKNCKTIPYEIFTNFKTERFSIIEKH